MIAVGLIGYCRVLTYKPRNPLRRKPSSGEYATWEGAAANASGYAAPEILEATRAATARVRDGEAAYERDTLTFDKPQFQWPLLAGLLRSAVGGRLSVLDFGGSLGTSYFQCRPFLPSLELRWSVVEQPAHVEVGQAEFENEQLRFYRTVDECLAAEQPNVLLLSGVLQYLPEPYTFLDETLALGIPEVIVDRTPFSADGLDRITVQQVPEWLYRGSYPAWKFDRQRFLDCFDGYRMVAEFDALDGDGHKGFVFES